MVVRAVPPFHFQPAQANHLGGKIPAKASLGAGFDARSVRPAAEIGIGVACRDTAACPYLEAGLNPALEPGCIGRLLRGCSELLQTRRGWRRWRGRLVPLTRQWAQMSTRLVPGDRPIPLVLGLTALPRQQWPNSVGAIEGGSPHCAAEVRAQVVGLVGYASRHGYKRETQRRTRSIRPATAGQR